MWRWHRTWHFSWAAYITPRIPVPVLVYEVHFGANVVGSGACGSIWWWCTWFNEIKFSRACVAWTCASLWVSLLPADCKMWTKTGAKDKHTHTPHACTRYQTLPCWVSYRTKKKSFRRCSTLPGVPSGTPRLKIWTRSPGLSGSDWRMVGYKIGSNTHKVHMPNLSNHIQIRLGYPIFSSHLGGPNMSVKLSNRPEKIVSRIVHHCDLCEHKILIGMFLSTSGAKRFLKVFKYAVSIEEICRKPNRCIIHLRP